MSAWLTKANVKAIQETAATGHDDLIDLLIPVLQQRFINESNYDPETGDRVEEMRVTNAREIALHYYPVTALTKIEEISGNYTSTLSSEYYTVHPDGIITFEFPISGRLKITYTAGYAADNIPKDIIEAIIEQIIDCLNKIPNRLGKKSKGVGGESETYEDIPLLPEFKSICELYRNPVPDRSIVS